MKKQVRILASILSVALLFTACGDSSLSAIEVPAEADPINLDNVGEGTAFEDLEYVDFDYEEWDALLTEIYELLDAQEPDVDRAFSLIDQIKEGYYAANLDYRLAQIYYMCDTTDEFYYEQYSSLSENFGQMQEDYQKLGFQLINKYQLGSYMAGHFTGEETQTFYQYSPTPDNILELAKEQGRLEAEYLELYAKVSYDGETGEFVGLDTYGPQMAEIYRQLVEVRREIGQNTNENNYVYYMDDSYGRDYSASDIENLETLVKSDLAPFLTLNMEATRENAEKLNPLFADLSDDDILLLIRNSLDEVSPKMQTVFAYAQEYNLILLTDGDNSVAGGFTFEIPDDYSYLEPVSYNYRYGGYSDFTDTIHEFGHFYVNYYGRSATIDVCESNSQGLEALYCCLYPELFGNKTGGMLERTEVLTLVSTVVTTTQTDEFERRVYQSDDISADAITDAYWEIAGEYGISQGDYAGSEYYWTMTHHLFDSPMYCISYAPSGMIALMLWANGTTDFDGAVDTYLAYEDASGITQFSDVLDATGFDEPWSQRGMSTVVNSLKIFY